MPGGPLNSLAGVRALDLSEDIAGAYCSKLLADAGADVLKVEPPSGHPLRAWSRTGSVGRDGDPDGILFRFLAAGQQSIVADFGDAADRSRVHDLLAGSDIVVTASAPRMAEIGFEINTFHELNPEATVVSLTPFGLAGPRHGLAANDFLLQALSGSLHNHGSWRGLPLAVGGGLGEWVAGAYGAVGALAARARLRRTGRGEVVDVSVLEALAVTLVCYPSVAASVPGGVRRRSTVEMVPGIEPCKDGFVGITTLTAQQWHDFAAMIERPDLLDNVKLNSARTRVAREAELRPAIHAWTEQHEVGEVIERAAMFRVPAAPVLNGASLPQFDALRQRGLFAKNPRGGFTHPRPPFLTTASEPRSVAGAPRLGEHTTSPFGSERATSSKRDASQDERLPLEGVKVLDVTAFWAGPTATQCLAALGADVIKVESTQRPDAMRFNVGVSPQTEQWWEQGYLYLSANLNKRAITLNLSDDRGRALFLRLAAQSDVVVENFTPRVMEHFELTYDTIRKVCPDIVMVSMPGWGLEGPWRDRPGFATTMEQASGMAFVTGYLDGPPMAPGLCDPLAGIHGAFAVLAALEERQKTGDGQHVELPVIDLAVNISVEQILEFEAYGELMTRSGNRSAQAAPQGVYACAEADEWLALSVNTEAQWTALVQAMDTLSWAADRDLATVAQRATVHDRIDTSIQQWCSQQSLAGALEALKAAGVQPVVPAYAIDEDPQMQARGFWEPVVHPIVGEHRYPGWPMRLSGGPERWYRSPAPLLGQHNEEVLHGLLGLTGDEIADLRRTDVIGERPLGL